MIRILAIFTLLISSNAFSESREKIIVIDTGVSKILSLQSFMCKDGSLSAVLMDSSPYDTMGHGTNIIGLIAKRINPITQCIISIRVSSNNSTINDYFRGLRIANSLKPKYVNISMSGKERIESELILIKSLLEKGVNINVAAGNESTDLDYKCDAYPSCLKNELPLNLRKKLHVIGSSTTKSSNKGKIVDVYLDGKDKGFPIMSGTSQATAIYTADLISR